MLPNLETQRGLFYNEHNDWSAMRLYHASNMAVEEPRIINRFITLDFGTGFYTTTNEEQAREFAVKTYYRRKRIGTPTVSVFEFNLDEARKRLEILEFSTPDKNWLRFVVHNRKEGRDPHRKADIIVGPVANDDVFETVALYEAGLIDEDAAIKRFKVKQLFNQVLFCNEQALSLLSFIGSQRIEVA